MGILRRAGRSTGLMAGGAVLAAILLVALLAPVLAPADPQAMNVRRRLAPPGPGAPLGTDHLGRDLLSRVLHGTRLSLFVGGSIALSATAGGIVLGLVGGYGGRGSGLVMRVVDGLMAFPGTMLALALMAVLGPRLSNTILALAVIYVPRVARVEHAAVLQTRGKEYVQAAVALGAGTGRVIFRYILPNTVAPVLVQSTFTFAFAVIAEAGLSFLGVGAPPATPTWGNIIASGRDYMLVAPWITVIPGLAILLVVLSLNLVGDGLRDILDPRLHGHTAARRGRARAAVEGMQA